MTSKQGDAVTVDPKSIASPEQRTTSAFEETLEEWSRSGALGEWEQEDEDAGVESDTKSSKPRPASIKEEQSDYEVQTDVGSEVQTDTDSQDISFERPVITPDERYLVFHMFSTKNNLRCTITDRTSKYVLATLSGGQFTKSDRLKGSPKVAELIFQKAVSVLNSFSVTRLELRSRAVGSMNIRGPTNAARTLITLLQKTFNCWRGVVRTTPESHGMHRPRAIRKVR